MKIFSLFISLYFYSLQFLIPFFVGISFFYIVIQVISWPSTWRAKAYFLWYLSIRTLLEGFSLSCELWWHCSRVIPPLMRPVKWVQRWWMLYLYLSSVCLMTNLPSFPLLHVWWSSEVDLNPFKVVSISSRSSSTPIFLGLWLCYHICSKDSLTKLPEVCPFGLDLFSLIPILSFSSSHNTHTLVSYY